MLTEQFLKAVWDLNAGSCEIAMWTYDAHSVAKPSNKLINLANKIDQFFIFNKISLWFMVR